MRKPLSLIIVVCCVALLGGSTASAGPRGRDLPDRYIPGSMDGRLVETLNPVDGTRWAAWAYRNGAEYDLAVAFRGETGFWSEPILIGVDDGVDQVQPTLAADNWGNVYLAYTERGPDRIMFSWLEADAPDWSAPITLTDPAISAMYPALRVVGDRLVVAFRAGRGSVILDLPLLDPGVSTNIFNDGPDPVEARDDNTGDPTDDTEADPLMPFDDSSGGSWGSASTS